MLDPKSSMRRGGWKSGGDGGDGRSKGGGIRRQKSLKGLFGGRGDSGNRIAGVRSARTKAETRKGERMPRYQLGIAMVLIVFLIYRAYIAPQCSCDGEINNKTVPQNSGDRSDGSYPNATSDSRTLTSTDNQTNHNQKQPSVTKQTKHDPSMIEVRQPPPTTSNYHKQRRKHTTHQPILIKSLSQSDTPFTFAPIPPKRNRTKFPCPPIQPQKKQQLSLQLANTTQKPLWTHQWHHWITPRTKQASFSTVRYVHTQAVLSSQGQTDRIRFFLFCNLPSSLDRPPPNTNYTSISMSHTPTRSDYSLSCLILTSNMHT